MGGYSLRIPAILNFLNIGSLPTSISPIPVVLIPTPPGQPISPVSMENYGFTERLTGILYFPFFVRALQNEQVSGTTGEVILAGDAVNSIGDTQLTLKYGIIQNQNINLSGSVSVGLPFGNNQGGRDGSLQTGTGEWNQMLRLDVSRSFRIGELYPFGSLYSAFNNRTNGFSDEFRYGAKIGLSLDRFALQLSVDGVKSFKNGDPNFNSEGTGLYSNNAEYLALYAGNIVQVYRQMGLEAQHMPQQ